jgi:hypothetical protein
MFVQQLTSLYALSSLLGSLCALSRSFLLHDPHAPTWLLLCVLLQRWSAPGWNPSGWTTTVPINPGWFITAPPFMTGIEADGAFILAVSWGPLHECKLHTSHLTHQLSP